MEQNLIFVALHKPRNGVPACIFKFYLEKNTVIDTRYNIRGTQIYARTNKILDVKNLKITDFKGKKGLEELFIGKNDLLEYLYLLIDEGYMVKRVTPHNTNRFADDVFEGVMAYQMRMAGRNGAFVLPK